MIVHMKGADMELAETWISIFQSQFHIKLTIFARIVVHTMRFGKNERILLKEILYSVGIAGVKSNSISI